MKKKTWKRTKQTTTLVHAIRKVLLDAGYEEELAITPLRSLLSVIARKGEDHFNIRLNKETLEIVSQEKLIYNVKRDNIRRVFREPICVQN